MHKEYSGKDRSAPGTVLAASGEDRSAPRTVLAASPSQGGSGGSMTDVAVPLLIMASLQIEVPNSTNLFKVAIYYFLRNKFVAFM